VIDGFERLDYFAWLGVSPHLRLLEDGDAIRRDLEASATRRGQGHLGIWKSMANLRRQTGGASFVASHRAVFDRDGHRS
jgi:hypothetical protein